MEREAGLGGELGTTNLILGKTANGDSLLPFPALLPPERHA
jgi:hypothetical protein